MNGRVLFFMIHVVTLQVIVLVLRVATSYQGIGIGLSALMIGVVSASFAIFPVIFSMPIGRMLDRYGERPALAGGSVILLVSAATFLMFRETTLGLTMATMLLGLGHFLSMVGQHSYVASHSDPARRDSQFGWYAAAISLGQALGPALIAFPAQGTQPDMGLVFMIGAAVTLLHFLLAIPVVMGVQKPKPRTGTGRSSIGSLVRTPGLPIAIMSGVAVMASLDLLAIYLPVLGAERHIDASIIAGLLVLRGVATLASRLGYGWMVRRFSRPRFLALTMGSSALGVALLTLPAPLPVMVVAICIVGFGLGAALPITLSIITDIAPPAERGTLLSLRQSAMRVSQVIIPVAGGGLALIAGVASVLWLLSLLLGGVAAVALRQAKIPS